MSTDDQNWTSRYVAFTCNLLDAEGNHLISLDEMVERLKNCSVLAKWAVILHDKDEGTQPHVQGIAHCERALDRALWAKKLQLSPEVLEKRSATSRRIKDGPFWEALLYLTHEGVDLGASKHVYERSEVIASEGIDVSAGLDAYWIERTATSNRKRQSLLNKVRFDGLSIRDACKAGLVNMNGARQARGQFLREQGVTPSYRVNFYVHGGDEIERLLLVQALAKTLAGEGSNEPSVYVWPGRNFDDYDGEAVIVAETDDLLRPWYRANDVLERGALTHTPWFRHVDALKTIQGVPTPFLVKSSTGGTRLIHEVTVLHGESSFEEVYNKLVAAFKRESDEKPERQAGLAIPVIIPVEAGQFGVQVNEHIENGGSFSGYAMLGRFRSGLAQAHRSLASASLDEPKKMELIEQIEHKTLVPVLEARDRVKTDFHNVVTGGSDAPTSPDEFLEMFADTGTAIEPIEGELIDDDDENEQTTTAPVARRGLSQQQRAVGQRILDKER